MVEQRLAELLASHATLKVATAGGTVSPWVAAAFFAEDGPFRLELVIEGRGKTFANLSVDPRVAVMIEDGNAMSLFAQGAGTAVVVPDDAARFRADLVAKTPGSAPLVGLPGLVPVRITIDRWFLTDVPGGWLPAKELVRASDGAEAPRRAPPPPAPSPPA
jgi:hypothetical protein